MVFSHGNRKVIETTFKQKDFYFLYRIRVEECIWGKEAFSTLLNHISFIPSYSEEKP